MRAIKTLREETRRRAEQSMQLKTHTEHHSQRRLLSQQTESEALFQQKLDRLVKQKREQQRRDRQWQQRLDALAAQRQRVAAMLQVHIETNEKLNNQLVASSHPSTNTTVSDEEEEASKEIEASSHLNQNLNLQLVASFNKEVSKELGAALCRKKVAQALARRALRRLFLAPDHASDHPKLRLASASRPPRSALVGHTGIVFDIGATQSARLHKELVAPPCRAPPDGEQCDHQAIMVSLNLARLPHGVPHAQTLHAPSKSCACSSTCDPCLSCPLP